LTSGPPKSSAIGGIQRYARLLAIELTPLEREYLHKRIAEEYAELERLQSHPPTEIGIWQHQRS
jgi:hypothetical protein